MPISEIGEVGSAPAATETTPEPVPFGTPAEEPTPEKLVKDAQPGTQTTQPESETLQTTPVDWDRQEESVSQTPVSPQTPTAEPKVESPSSVHESNEESAKEVVPASTDRAAEKEPQPRDERNEVVSTVGGEKAAQLPDVDTPSKQDDDEWSFEASVGTETPSPVQEAPSSYISLEDVYNFIEEHLLRSSDGKRFPTFVVVGLPGSGKTSYLTMLGAILLMAHERENRIFYFPYEVGIGWLNASTLARRVFGRNPSGKQAELAKAIDCLLYTSPSPRDRG